ncbi:MAG TPA: hypothetical protein VGO61_03995 [Steroidobacteraceae bacterium]|jgi:hypothetical protein|nr:hypothetical protein [Steroidobacteraceae bacterium]
MKTILFALALLLAAQESSAACAQKRNRDFTFIELMVPEGAPRPAGAADFSFITDETTIDQLIAKVGPPDASQGTRTSEFIYCFADGTELLVGSRDHVAIDYVRYKSKQIFKRGKKK